MKKKLYILVLLLASAIISKAQQYYPKVIGYSAGQRIQHNGTAAGDTFAVSFSGGAPFATIWKSALPNGTNYAMSGMRHDILFVDNAFDKDLFASKGYYGDFVELKWDMIRYADQITGFKIYRKVLGSASDSVQVANIPADSRSWHDDYAESGVIYKYFLFAEGIFPAYKKFINYIEGIGFRVPYGRISGRVTYAGGAAVSNVGIIAETSDNFSGYSILLNGTDAYLAISPALDDPLFKLDTAMTFQAWFRPQAPIVSSTLFEKQGQYKLTHSAGSLTFTAGTQSLSLNFTEKIDTFFQVTAMRTADSLKLMLIYDENTVYTAKAKLTATTTANNNPIFLGKDNTGNFFKGQVDEVKIWHKSFSENDIKKYSGMYFSGTESELSAYYRMNEGVGDAFYDLSRKGFTFNENHGYKHNTAQWSTIVPFTKQLAVKGITDNNGNYIISGIPYATDGSVYRFVPVYGIHSFDPTEQLLFIGPGATTHSNVDFTDVASFPVTGEVFYRDTYFPVQGATLKIDGQTAVTSAGNPIVTDAAGKFTLDVPIGQHFIQIEKYGHGFINNGRFPATEGTVYDFQQAYTFQTPFEDTTLIKVIGKVVGGPVQADKPKGLGKTINNLGAAKIVFRTQKGFDLAKGDTTNIRQNEMYEDNLLKDKGDTKFTIIGTAPKQIEIEPDPVTGEFFAYLLPEKYVIKGITAGTYTYPAEFNSVVDLSKAYLWSTEIDSVVSGTIITSLGDTINNYRIDSVRYQKNLDLIYRVNPTLSVTAKDGNPRFWEDSVKAKDGTVVNVVDGSGNPLTDWPIFIQRKKYDLKVSVFERYQNGALIDDVPVTDGKVEVVNAIASDKSKKLFQVSKQGVVNYSFKGGLANIVGDYTNSMSIVAYTGPGGSIQTSWDYNNSATSYTGPFKAYVIGGLPSGNNFVTTGPTNIDMILRDPAGSNSYAYFEKGSTVTTTTTTNVLDENSASLSSDFMLGGAVKTFAGLGAGVIINTEKHNTITVGLESSKTWIDENTTTTTVTATKRWQTSDTEDFVGALGDVFIGHSTNIVYGKCTFISLLTPTQGSGHIGNAVSGYQIGQYVGVRVNPEYGTGFQYSLNHIKNYLIPNLKFLRDNFLQTHTGAPYYYNSHYPVGDSLYASDNNPRATSADQISYTGSSYNFTIPASWPADSLFTDSVEYYNKQIKAWENILAKNEKEKINAVLKENLSYDAGVIYESSETHDNTKIETSTYEWQLSPKLANETGFEVNKIGVTINFERNSKQVETKTDGTETTSSVTFGYVLNDNDVGDYFSVDVKTPPTHTGPVFATRGGQSQCPYEHAEVTDYYQPGTTISEAVMQREVPKIACDVPVQINVPADQKAIFQVQLQNASETGDDAWYMVSIDEQSNQNGAKVSLDGHSILNGRVIFVPGGSALNKTITIEKTNPAVNDYNDIGIILHSVCQFDPSDNWPDIADTVILTAHFKPVCSGVDLTSPSDQWVINTNTTPIDIQNIVIDNYNLAHTGFEKIIFQYKPASSSQWISDKFYYVNQADFDASTESNKEWINNAPTLTYQWNMNSLQDRNYMVRAITMCADGTENESITMNGIKDTKRPKIFGTPQPGDGILSPGDDVMLTFDETIEASLLLSSNFSVKGVLNGAELRHNSALYFDGIDDYASVIAGVNLQNKSFAIEFWTKRADLTPGVIMNQGDIQLGFNAANQFYVKLGNQTQNTSQVYDFTDKWIHFTVSFDYNTKILNAYSAFDGHNAIEFENVSFPNTFNGLARMYIGKDNDNVNPFNGYLHDFRIWEKSIGYGTAVSNMLISLNGDEIGLGGMWPMNEAVGLYARDLARSHNASLENGTSWKVFPTGYARTFDGSSARIDFPTASSVIITDEMDFTLEYWFKATPAQANTVMFSNGKTDGTDGAAATPDIWETGINASGEIYAKNNGTVINVSGEDFLDNKWHHLALVLKRNGNTSLYVDGNLKSFSSSINFGGLKGTNMTIGASRQYLNSSVASNFFNGSIDEFRIWKLARTSKLLNMDMNSKLKGDEKGLVAYYPFDKYDVNLILQPVLDDNDIDDNTGNLTGLTAVAFGGNFDNTNVPNVKDARPVQNLAFDWVVNDDKLIINLNEPVELIEKTVVEFTVDRAEDMYENRMASPVTWTAYIKKNTVIWNQSQINLQKELYAPLSFDVDILNTGGVEQNFKISNLPSWLSADVIEGNLLPDSYRTIHFTVSENTNIGNYDVSLFLTSDFGYSEKLNLNLKVFKTPPVWDYNPLDYQYSMSVVGQVKIDGIFSTNPDDIVAAFVGNECRGKVNLTYVPEYDIYEVFLNIYSNSLSGEQVTFKIWNASEGIVHDNVTPEMIFAYNTITGSPASPQILETFNSYNGEIKLFSGWKWVSLNLNDPNLSDINSLFAGVSAQSGDQIKGQTLFDNFGSNLGWTGSLSNSGGIKKENMYMVKLSKEDTLHLSGSKFSPLNVPISLNPGWSWIGYIPRINIAVNDALGNYSATAGDLIKSQYEFAMYDPAMGWVGSLQYLKPGEGYMYKNMNTSTGTLLYPEGAFKNSAIEHKNPVFPGEILTPENYQNNMSMIVKVVPDNFNINQKYILGAFFNNEIRGTASPVLLNGQYYYFLTVYSDNQGEQINFKLADLSTNNIFAVNEIYSFASNNIIGSTDNPDILTISGATDVNIISDFNAEIYPNPVHDEFNIEINSKDLNNILFEISDITGKVLKSDHIFSNKTIVDLRGYVNGLYFLKIKTLKGDYVKKIILNK